MTLLFRECYLLLDLCKRLLGHFNLRLSSGREMRFNGVHELIQIWLLLKRCLNRFEAVSHGIGSCRYDWNQPKTRLLRKRSKLMQMLLLQLVPAVHSLVDILFLLNILSLVINLLQLNIHEIPERFPHSYINIL